MYYKFFISPRRCLFCYIKSLDRCDKDYFSGIRLLALKVGKSAPQSDLCTASFTMECLAKACALFVLFLA